jgi:DNA polymerase-3 subunit delta'
MTVWSGFTGQEHAIDVLRAAANDSSDDRNAADEHGGGRGMTHAWLMTGPPGSGRSNLAYAFAAALLCDNRGCAECADCRLVEAHTHPDLTVLTTERVIISIDEVRALVSGSQLSAAAGRYRVMVIEDADRMSERTSTVLLKALEEPPENTVWILCAPNEADLIPTVRSRVRSVRLRVPSIGDVAALLQRRDGIDFARAERAARHAQGHIGMAHRLATNDDAQGRRDETLSIVASLTDVSGAVRAAARLLEIAGDDAKALAADRDEHDRHDTLRSLGVQPGGPVPPALRAQLRVADDDQKRRTVRTLRDGIDRILIDVLSLYRDVVRLQCGVESDLVNTEMRASLDRLAAEMTPAATLATIEALDRARERIDANVAPLLALEAMLVIAARRDII